MYTRYSVHIMNNKYRDDALTLEVLEAVVDQKQLTQRDLARQLGVALGLANSYLKRCTRKGLIKIHQAPANRYLYYLTPKGFAEKSRLTAQYLSYSLDFYRKSGLSYARAFQLCERNGWKKVVLYGASELAEIASIRALEHDLDIIGIYDRSSQRERFLNIPVWKQFSALPGMDVLLLTALEDPAASYEAIIQDVSPEKVLVPDILTMSAKAAEQA